MSIRYFSSPPTVAAMLPYITDISCEPLCVTDEPEEDEEALAQRLQLLEDSRKLRMMAEFFLHPEKPVRTNPAAFGRCYFQRASAPQQVSQDEYEEAYKIVSDAMALKKLAVDYKHPELPVEFCEGARCYFERASAPAQDLAGEAEQKSQILLELATLKNAAYDYLHPEAPVATTNATIFGRNYFSRFAATEMVTKEEQPERELVLKEANELRKLAQNAPVEVDPAAMGRNYFSRPSAPAQTSLEEEEETQLILQENMALRKLAKDYLHPELPVETNPTSFGRNYFNRPSASEPEDEAERLLILNEAKSLKKLAKDYLHPELPVLVNDPNIFGRNYFTRPAAPLQEDHNEEREQILADVLHLERLAVEYNHPELPVQTDEQVLLSREVYGPKKTINYVAKEHDLYHHHAHFDMDDDIHLHHVGFDQSNEHHSEISEFQFTTPRTSKAFVDDFDMKIAMSPGCVMTFSQLQLPDMA